MINFINIYLQNMIMVKFLIRIKDYTLFSNVI